jgi:Spy/CpxP family protein refolding chaperone
MSVSSFFYGLITALVIVTAAMAAIYWYLKRKRIKPTSIKGYLDLIPDLTLEQKDQLQEIRRVFLPKVDGIRQNLYLKRAELAELLFTEPPDRSRIDDVAQQIMQHQSELEKEVIDHILEEKEILSPSQKRTFFDIIVEQFSSGGLGVHDVKGRRR